MHKRHDRIDKPGLAPDLLFLKSFSLGCDETTVLDLDPHTLSGFEAGGPMKPANVTLLNKGRTRCWQTRTLRPETKSGQK